MIAIDKARAQIEIAKELLRNHAKPKDGLFQNKKYVKKAGLTAYKGLFLLLVELLKEDSKGQKVIIEQDLFKLNKRIFADFITAQQVLSKSRGVYGTRSQDLAKLGILEAENIITWVEKCLNKRQKRAEMLFKDMQTNY
ncbi:DUF5618 family protein [Dyadobacter sp. CY356]|uniref:DUF5618 family protein n=1 Tax=Dyadobacter sp. CY356 TaxID=2906442 RepID=UPI001F2158CF|nr:DUF5618 family protein [Dyadobacter sp. CY356]MCF0059378.1 DUF5618 family protein [Dyadobacter sp. CY356]